MNPKTITALDVVPVIPLEQCWAHLRITPDGSPPSHPDDALILGLLSAAREWIEGYTGIALTPRTLELAIDGFPYDEIQLPMPPLVGIVSVRYVADDGLEYEIPSTDHVIDDYSRPGWLFPASGIGWPTAAAVINAVTIRYTAGFNLWSDEVQTRPLPTSLKTALLLLLGALYENREDASEVRLSEVPIGVRSMCEWQRVRKGMA